MSNMEQTQLSHLSIICLRVNSDSIRGRLAREGTAARDFAKAGYAADTYTRPRTSKPNQRLRHTRAAKNSRTCLIRSRFVPDIERCLHELMTVRFTVSSDAVRMVHALSVG
jgi:hypothetical protein